MKPDIPCPPTLVPQEQLTVQCGQRLLVTIQDDGLGGGPGWGPGSRCPCLSPIRTVQPLDVELEMPVTVEAEGGGEKAQGRPHHACLAAPACLSLASPLPAEVAREGFLIGVGQHVPPQVLLVLGGKAALAALVGPQA